MNSKIYASDGTEIKRIVKGGAAHKKTYKFMVVTKTENGWWDRLVTNSEKTAKAAVRKFNKQGETAEMVNLEN